jgi:hypothetical protein
MQHRAGHFMKATMLDSQLSTLQEPHETDEVNVSVVKLGSGPDEATGQGGGHPGSGRKDQPQGRTVTFAARVSLDIRP